MQRDHEQYHKPENKGSWWLSRDGIIALIFLGFIGFYLITEHQAHLYYALPGLILLACPFMHHGHGVHSNTAKWMSKKGGTIIKPIYDRERVTTGTLGDDTRVCLF